MVDLTFLYSFTKGDVKKIKRYIGMYLKMMPETLDRMAQNIEEENWSDLAINAHSVKPLAEYMGIQSLKEALKEIEDKVRAGITDNVNELFADVKRLHVESEAQLQISLLEL